MAMRRPRIKAAANLVNIKRNKPKPAVVQPNDDVIKNVDIKEDLNLRGPSVKENSKNDTLEETKNLTTSTSETCSSSDIDHIPKLNDLNPHQQLSIGNNDIHSNLKETVLATFEDALPTITTNDVAFKQPTKKTIVMPMGSPFNPYKSEDGYNSDIDNNNIMQMDLQRAANGFPMSPTKQQQQQQTRPRIRPSPIIGQRRNSYVGSSPSPHTTTTNTISDESSGNEFIIPSPRRERYHSTGLSFGHNSSASSPHKYMSIINARTRTDSNCSAFSDIISSNQTVTNPLMLSKIRKPNTNEVCNNRSIWLKDYESRCPNGIADKTRLKMLDLIYYNPTTNPMENKHNNKNNNNIKLENNKIEIKIDDDNEKKAMNSAPVPQLKLNANNELVLDDKSLEIETTAEQEARKLLANTSLVVVDENTGTNGFYRRQKRTREWPHEETIKFYRCLQTVGTDFSLMVQLFPKRNRRDLKLKFKKEERNNGALINKAILYPKNFDIDTLKQQLEADERKREEELRKWREIEAKSVVRAEKLHVKSRAERPLQNGLDIYENENVPKKHMSKRAKKITIKRKPSENSQNMQNNEVKELSETNKILKNHVEKSLRQREDQNKTKAIQIETKSKKPRYEDELLKNDKTKKKIKMETNVTKNEIIPLDIDNKQLECELEELLQIDVEQNPEQFNEINETQLGKTITDLDNGKAIQILSLEECKPEDKNMDQMKVDNTETLFNITQVRSLDSNQKEEEIFYTFENNIYEESIITTEAAAAEAAIENVIVEEEKKEIDDISLKSDVDISLKSDIGESTIDDEDTIQRIIQQIEEGGLMLVSSIDPNNLDKVINEIYMIDKNTGDLCEQPLMLPDDIVQSIVELAT